MLNTISNQRSPHLSAGQTVPELEQSKANVLATLPSSHSRRSYEHAISKFIDWYCSEPRLGVDQLHLRENHWVIADLAGKGGRVRTVPVPGWCKGLQDVWLSASGVKEGRMFRRLRKSGVRQEAGVTVNVVWDVVKRCARDAGIDHLAPHDLRRYAECRIMPNHLCISGQERFL